MKKILTRLLSLVLLGTFIPSFVLADNWDLDKGSITVSATAESQTVSQAGGSPTVDHNPVITSSGTTTNHTVIIEAAAGAEAKVTLEDVNIHTGVAAISTSGQGDVNIELDGTNTVQSGTNHAGVEKNSTGTLTIKDEENNKGSLTATGGYSDAQKSEILAILTKKEYGQFMDYVQSKDPNAFVTISNVKRVVGSWNTPKRRTYF